MAEIDAAIIQADALQQKVQPEVIPAKPEVNLSERRRLIVHLGRLFSRRYDIQVLPSGQKEMWACSLDPKTSKAVDEYIHDKRTTLDDLPEGSFTPTQILYDEQAIGEMPMDNINTLLRHESGHAKYTDFRLMVEGQKQAKTEGYLPTSFWLLFEGIEDPRVNIREGDESPAIDRMIKENQGKDLKDRLTETPITKRPLMWQLAYDCLHYYVHGETIPELKGTEVDKIFEQARPLIDLYFQNTDPAERKNLQQQIWDIVKQMEQKATEQEEKREMAKRKQQGGQQSQQGDGSGNGQSSGQGESQQSENPQTEQSGGHGQPGQESSSSQQQQGQESGQGNSSGQQSRGFKGVMDRLKKAIKGSQQGDQGTQTQEPGSKTDQGDQDEKHDTKTTSPQKSTGQEKGQDLNQPDLSELSEQELQEIQEAIDQMSPQEKAELRKKAREALDQMQRQALEDKLPKTMKLEKNKQTGEWEAVPQMTDAKQQKQAQEKYQEALQQVETEETAEAQRIAELQRQEEERQRKLREEQREKIEMLKNGFDPETEREKYRLYRDLEESMRAQIYNFRKAMETVVPRHKEPNYEGPYFGGKRIDKRELVRKVPIKSEQFWQRQAETPTGEPRLFIGLCVDNSGSMSGIKMEQARKTTIFFSCVCQNMGIPFMMTAFGDGAETVKELRQDFDDPSKKIKPRLIDATDASDGSTNLHAGLELTIKAMNEERRHLRDSHGLIFVITDGGANAGKTGRTLKQYIEENKGRLTFKAFGLSGSQGERTSIQTQLDQYFGDSNCAFPETFEDLPNDAFTLLRKNMAQFQRFLMT